MKLSVVFSQIVLPMSTPVVATVISQTVFWGSDGYPQLEYAIVAVLCIGLFIRVSSPYGPGVEAAVWRLVVVGAYIAGCVVTVVLWNRGLSENLFPGNAPQPNPEKLLFGFLLGFLLVYFAAFPRALSSKLRDPDADVEDVIVGGNLSAVFWRSAISVGIILSLFWGVSRFGGNEGSLLGLQLPIVLGVSVLVIFIVFFGAEKDVRTKILEIISKILSPSRSS